VRILDHIKDEAERHWYIHQTFQYGWSRDVLVMQIESGLYRRQGKAITNFDKTLPGLQSDLAQQVLKDPYSSEFLHPVLGILEQRYKKYHRNFQRS
jgi:predicted nuclease of restriction endonuclease-like (RecB) superfamily